MTLADVACTPQRGKSIALSSMDRGPHFWRRLAWLGLLLVSSLYVVGLLEPFASSIATIDLAAADFAGASPFVAANTHRDVAGTNEGPAQLFGMESELVPDGALLDKWHRVLNAISEDMEAIAQCHAGKSCAASVQRLLELSLKGAGRDERARVGLINRAVDLAIRPASDERQWGIQDHWSDPLETLDSRRGDCEDYAIVKYTALLAAGLSKDAVKLVVMKNQFPDEDHAVVAVWVDKQWLILDNRTLTLVRDTDVRRAFPKFVLDDQGVRRFVWRSKVVKSTS